MNKKSLLWVDDEVELLQPHVLFLEKKGYKLDTCHNGIDAISLVKENDYDLVLLDENMPGMSGIEVLEIIKEDPFNPKYDYPVLFNYNKIHRAGGRIDHLEIIEEIKLNKSKIGDIKVLNLTN